MNKINTVKEYQELLAAPGRHIVKVSASWCGPCKVLSSIIDELMDEIKSKIVEVNADEAEEELLSILHVRNVPLLVFYDGDKEYARRVGVETKEGLMTLVNDTNS